MTLVRLSSCLPVWHADDDSNFLTAWLHYAPADPYFVRIHVAGGVVSLEVPREVLVQGMTEVAVCTDLHAGPDRHEEFLLWTLRWNPDDPLTFRVPRENVRAFLDETFRLVPDGEESTRIDWDAAAEELLEETPDGPDAHGV